MKRDEQLLGAFPASSVLPSPFLTPSLHEEDLRKAHRESTLEVGSRGLLLTPELTTK